MLMINEVLTVAVKLKGNISAASLDILQPNFIASLSGVLDRNYECIRDYLQAGHTAEPPNHRKWMLPVPRACP